MIKINRQEFKKKKLKTAVLFLVFNRPKITKQVFEAIRKAKPPRLYVAADGPRECKLGEVERVEETRAIAMSVDWPCKLRLFFRKRNLGCARAVTEGISWFFKYETQGIIIEDDILPSNAFFYFIEKNLNIYKKKNVWAITGTNLLFGSKINPAPCFSLHGSIWGWGTWRNRWKRFDKNINSGKLKNYATSFYEKVSFLQLINFLKKNKLEKRNKYWDFYWLLKRIENNGLTLMPKNNYVKNIGFASGENYTHNKTLFKYPKICNKLEKISVLKITRSFAYDKHLWYYKNGAFLNFKIALIFLLKKLQINLKILNDK